MGTLYVAWFPIVSLEDRDEVVPEPNLPDLLIE